MTKAELIQLDRLLAKFQDHLDKKYVLHVGFERVVGVCADVDKQIEKEDKATGYPK